MQETFGTEPYDLSAFCCTYICELNLSFYGMSTIPITHESPQLCFLSQIGISCVAVPDLFFLGHCYRDSGAGELLRFIR